ncbi:hypothetical protein BH09MYX1_BH09MYX1_54830 [soil metagenome]
MEHRFGHDFSATRVHAGSAAAEAADSVGARAFTFGHDVVFGAGEYRPETASGHGLLAHELAHVVQQSASAPWIQRKPKGAVPPSVPESDFEAIHGDIYLAGYTIDGVTIRVSISVKQRAKVEKNLVAIAAAINAANRAISDERHKVKICAIANAVTRFTTFKKQPVLSIAPENADVATVRHELGHATFEYLRSIQKTRNPLNRTALQITDIFRQLAATKKVKQTERSLVVERMKVEDHREERAAGLWLADPPQWSKVRNIKSEHPWDDADEMFASAREAFLTDRKGFEASIARFSKLDSNVRAPAHQLVAILDAMAKGEPADASVPTPSKEAATDLEKIRHGVPTEETLAASVNDTLRWALDPTTWPFAGLTLPPAVIPARLKAPEIGGVTSGTKPTYTIDDVKARLAKKNEGPVRGDLAVRALEELGWTIRFWRNAGPTAKTFDDGSLIMLEPDKSLEFSVVALFHESIHARYTLAGATTDEAKNLEDELRAKYQEFLFLRAHIDTNPNIAKGTMFEYELSPAKVKKTKAMTHEDIVTLFATDTVVAVMSSNVMAGVYPHFRQALADESGNPDLGKLIGHPAIEKLVRRALRSTREYLLEELTEKAIGRMSGRVQNGP